MGRAVLILNRPTERRKAQDWIAKAPDGTIVEFRTSKRSLQQNAKFHAMVTKLAQKTLYHGQKLEVDDWKLIFMDALNREVRAVPSLDGRGFVNLGRRTSRLNKEDFAELIELVAAYAAQIGVDLGQERESA